MPIRESIKELVKDATHIPPFVPKLATQVSNKVVPEIGIDTLTLAPIFDEKSGNNVRLAIHAIKSAAGPGGENLPRFISVIVGDQKFEAVDVTGAGTYVTELRIAQSLVPPRPLVAPMGLPSGVGSPTNVAAFHWGCETVKCWKGCKGIIFGGECRVCIKCHFGD